MTIRTPLIAAGCGLVLASAAGAFALNAFAAPKPAAPAEVSPVCIRVRDVDGVSVSSPIGPKQQDGVYIRMRNKDNYQISLSTICSELQDSVKIGIESRNNTGTICQATDAVVVAQDATTGKRRECWADTLHKLTPTELAAVPEKERP